MTTIACEYCLRAFSTLRTLRQHHERCRTRELRLQREHFEMQLQQQQEQYEEKLQWYRVQLKHQREQYERQLQTYESQLQLVHEQYDQQLHAHLTKIDKLENQLFEIAKIPTNTTTSYIQTQTNQRTLTIINQLGAYEFDPDEIERQLDEKFTKEVFQGGPDKIAEIAARVILFDAASQKPRVICTDISRKTYRYIDPVTQTLETDPGFRKTHKLIRYPLGQANLRIYCDHFQHDDSDDANRDQWKANDLFIEDQIKFPEKLYQFFVKAIR